MGIFLGGRGWGCEILNPRRPCPCPCLGCSEKPKQITPVWTSVVRNADNAMQWITQSFVSLIADTLYSLDNDLSTESGTDS